VEVEVAGILIITRAIHFKSTQSLFRSYLLGLKEGADVSSCV
jgi:hypothetical protein